MNLETEGRRGGLPGEHVPDQVIAQAKAAFAQRMAGELAQLVFDSVVDEGDSASDHHLRFEHRLFAVDIRVLSNQRASTLEGSLFPITSLNVGLQAEGEDVTIRQDVVDGKFVFSGITHGLVRLHLTGPETPNIRTDWFRI